MQQLLFGSWGPQIVGLGRDAAAYGVQYPWRVSAIVLVVVLALDALVRKRSGTGDCPEFGGDADGSAD